MELELEIKTCWVTYQCDSCREGLMEFVPGSACSNAKWHKHLCLKCGHEVFFKKKYPMKKEQKGWSW